MPRLQDICSSPRTSRSSTWLLVLLLSLPTLTALPALAEMDLGPIETKLDSVETWDRITALRDLMRLRPPEEQARPLVEKMLDDPHPDVRGEAIWAAYEIFGPKGVDVFEKLYADPDRRVRDSAIRAACRHFDDQACRDLCTAAFDDPDFGARIEVINTLKENFPQHDKAAAIFRRGLQDRSEMVQRAAVFGSQAARDDAAVATLAKIARTQSDVAAVPAVEEALATIGSKEAVAALVSLLPRPEKPNEQGRLVPSDLVRAAAARALARIKDPSSVSALRGVLDDPSVPVRIGALDALTEMRDESSIPAIATQLQHENDRVRKTALRALRRIGDPAAAKDVRRVLREDDDEFVRASAAITIADLLGKDAIADLRALREDLSASVRLEAAGALAGLGKDATGALVAFLDDSNAGVRLMAVEGIGQTGDPSQIPRLEKLIEDGSRENRQVRLKVAEALARIGDEKGLPALLTLAGDEEPSVRQHAARGLGALGGEEAKKALAGMLKDPVAMVRDAARRALDGAAGGR